MAGCASGASPPRNGSSRLLFWNCSRVMWLSLKAVSHIASACSSLGPPPWPSAAVGAGFCLQIGGGLLAGAVLLRLLLAPA